MRRYQPTTASACADRRSGRERGLNRDRPYADELLDGFAGDAYLGGTGPGARDITVFPSQTHHYGGLFGGEALAMMGKAAFITATRRARAVMVMAASRQMDFIAPIKGGDMVELRSRVTAIGRTSLTAEVELWGENVLSGERTRSAVGEFVMVAVDAAGRPTPIVAAAGAAASAA